MQPLAVSYPPSAVLADLVRALPGAALCFLIAYSALRQELVWVAGAFLFVSLLFVGLAGIAVRRWRLKFSLEEEGLRCGRTLCRWAEIEEVRLRYWAGLRQRGPDAHGRMRGMLALRLTFACGRGPERTPWWHRWHRWHRARRRVRFESSCVHFAALARAAAAAASHKGLVLDEPTTHNLEAMQAQSAQETEGA